jgi:eukaryotic-like serine/threonine-protein kinase
MKPERWRQVEELYHAALEREPEARAAFLAQACAGDDALRREVDSLLGFDNRAERFIETPALEVAARLFAPDEERFAGDKPQDLPLTEGRIGPYKVLREIGRGGMGVVFLAERDDEYRKQVAIKLIKRGMDSQAILTRFHTERQILAHLEHSNIARLLDGGTTTDGLPYLVMEYIEGLPIDDYADKHKLTITARLQLFLQVCAAVQHSHQHLVVHRDIKPSNILVTAEGVAKLLDFGIAKLVAPDTGVAETLSARGWMTPEYSSPEQLRGEAITTANDVYSLGVVLYKLLAGRLPYYFEYRSPQEIAEVIFKRDPDKPSTAAIRVPSTSGHEDVRTVLSPETISEAREGTPDKLRRRLRGDLDNIVLKALHREKDLRYHSVADLAEDIRRHLEGHPVSARKDTLAYRTWKFIGRNRAVAGISSLLVLALIGGTLATLWQARQAKVQRDLAVHAQEKAERRFNDVRKLAHAFMFDYHDAIRDLPGSTPVRERLVKDALTYLNSLAEEAAGDKSLQVELADGYGRVSDVQGGSAYASLGDTVGAIESARRCLQIRESLLTSEPDNLNYISITAGAYARLGHLLSETTDTSGALDSYQKSAAMYETVVSREPENNDYQAKLAASLGDLGGFFSGQGEWSRSIEKQQQALQIYEQLLSKDSHNRAYRRAKAVFHKTLGEALLRTGNVAEAEEQSRKAILILTELTEEEPGSTEYRRLLSTAYFSLGHVLLNQNNLAQAMENYQKCATLAEALAADDVKNVTFRLDAAIAQTRVGDVLSEMDRDHEAVPYYRQSLATREAVAKTDPTNIWKRWLLIEGEARIALALAYVDDRVGSVEHCRKVIELVEATDESAEIAQYRNARALTYTRVADTYGVFAREEKVPVRERLSYWQMTRRLYQKALDIWLEMKHQGTFGSTQESTFAAVKRLIKDCDAALAKGGKPDE